MDHDIWLDSAARKQVLVFKQNNPQWSEFSLRVYIAGKGCDGFDYGVTFDAPCEDDKRFTQRDEEGHVYDIVIDPETFKFVRHSTLTWVDDERGKGFLVENPHHKKFRGKFFKRNGWEARLLEGGRSVTSNAVERSPKE